MRSFQYKKQWIWLKTHTPYLVELSLTDEQKTATLKQALTRIRTFKPMGRQFVYAISYFDDTVIYVSESVKEVLGYDRQEITEPDVFYDIIHPDDIEMVKEATIKAVGMGENIYRIAPLQHVFHIDYRVKRTDGKYIRVQRQTGMLTRDENGNMTTSFGIYTDISHLKRGNEINLMMSGPEIRNFNFDSFLQQEGPFTKREKQIIELLVDGFKSEEIATKLCISKETVSTHRRNILGKVKVKNSLELTAYIIKNGL
ncbi:MAG: PAS domain-containing protein [Flavobacteriales bacterium]|nr:PAS domain-containing protein [Flavobacteriales bacterium]